VSARDGLAELGVARMAAYIFVVDEDNFELCVERGVCGCPRHEKPRINARAIADVAGIRAGANIGFYVKGVGIYGFFKAKGPAFYDETLIWRNPDQVLPYRALIEPTDSTFEKPIALSDLYDLADKDILWSWRGIVQRDCHPFTNMEAFEILRLLHRSNPWASSRKFVTNPYIPQDPKPLPIHIKADTSGRIVTEGGPEAFLMAWLLREFSGGKLKEIFGNYTDYINYVPTSYRKEMDILLLHETPEPHRVLTSCTIVELKAGKCETKDLSQIIRYEDWLVKKKCSGDSGMVRSIIVAHHFDSNVVSYVRQRAEIEGRIVKLVKYTCANSTLKLEDFM